MKTSYSSRFSSTEMSQLDTVPLNDTETMITRIFVPGAHRGLGHGQRLLQEVMSDADAERRDLHLYVSPYGNLSYAQILNWLENNGFFQAEPHGIVVRYAGSRVAYKVVSRTHGQLMSSATSFLGKYAATYVPGKQTLPPLGGSKLFVFDNYTQAQAYVLMPEDEFWQCVVPCNGMVRGSGQLIPWPNPSEIEKYWKTGKFDDLAEAKCRFTADILAVDWVQLVKKLPAKSQ